MKQLRWILILAFMAATGCVSSDALRATAVGGTRPEDLVQKLFVDRLQRPFPSRDPNLELRDLAQDLTPRLRAGIDDFVPRFEAFNRRYGDVHSELPIPSLYVWVGCDPLSSCKARPPKTVVRKGRQTATTAEFRVAYSGHPSATRQIVVRLVKHDRWLVDEVEYVVDKGYVETELESLHFSAMIRYLQREMTEAETWVKQHPGEVQKARIAKARREKAWAEKAREERGRGAVTFDRGANSDR